jgi:bifunctional non-homologous end joining protein LigD
MRLPVIQPMEPILQTTIPQSDKYWYQVKWDGVRLLACKDESGWWLYNRKQNERTQTYPDLLAELTLLECESVLLDGEVVALKDGRPDFFRVLKRDLGSPANQSRLMDRIPVYYMVFDLLFADGRWWTDRPLSERYERLTRLIPPELKRIHVCDNYENGTALFETMKKKEMEGIVIKEREGVYHVGHKHPTWQKVKYFREMRAAVIGATLRQGRVNALILGEPAGAPERYIGKAATGLNQQELTILTQFLPQLQMSKPPVAVVPRFPSTETVVWLQPLLTVQVRFLSWTPDGTLRSPVINGFPLSP